MQSNDHTDLPIHAQFEFQSAARPWAIALMHGNEHITYHELNARSNKLAHYLRSLGVGPDVRVGVCMDRSTDLVVGLLGILKAGGAYVCLDPAFPDERLSFMLEDSGVIIVLAREPAADHVRSHTRIVLCLDQMEGVLGDMPSSNLTCRIDSENLAYVIYTSGSTGKPKGAEIPHRGIWGYMFGVNYVKFDENHTFLQYSSVSWDAHTLELWTALLYGARCILYPHGNIAPEELATVINTMGVTTLWMSAALFNIMIDTRPDAFINVMDLMIGGEALSVSHVRKAFDLLPSTRIVNGYGPSECTVFTCCYPIPRDLSTDSASVPVGRPIGDRRVRLLDPDMRPTPIGIAGELHVGGPGLARGYLQRPDITAESFVPDPFSKIPGARLYRTGDLARFLPGGNIEFAGRMDDQVKIRGFRIELGEIEAALMSHGDVNAAAVLAREDSPGDKRLVAYIAGEASVSVSSIRDHLGRTLPDYMLPSSFVFMRVLPLNPNGKIDRKALPAPSSGRPEIGFGYAAPSTEVEHLLAGIWQDVLGVDHVGVHDNFFDLGGHSLLATQMISRVRTVFQMDVPFRVLFEAPTVAEIAEHIEAAQRESAGLLAPPIVPTGRDRPLPLSFAQQRLWFIDQLEPGGSAYNVPAAVRLTGFLNTDAFERTFHEIVRRHEPLRTTFRMIGAQGVQIVNPHQAFPISMVDLKPVPAADREAHALNLAQIEARTPFDLSEGPLLRVTLLHLDEQEHIVLLTMHHIVSDGWSTGLLIEEIRKLYAAYSANEPSPLPELAIQYADFAIWQRNWLQGEVLQKQLAYWREQLAGLQPLELTTDYLRPPVATHRGAKVSFDAPSDLAEALQSLSRRYGATLFMTLLSSWQVVLSRCTGQNDIAVGTDVAGRNRAETENLIGFFINQLVIRSRISNSMSFAELLQQVRETSLAAYTHQDLPFERLVDELAPIRDLSRSPVFQVKLVFQNTPHENLELGDLVLSGFAGEITTTKLDVHLTLEYNPHQGITGTVLYATDLFAERTIQRLLEDFKRVLESVVADANRPLMSITLASGEERRQILDGWGSGDVAATDIDHLSEEELDRLLTHLVEEGNQAR